jgi:hypothetical protein
MIRLLMRLFRRRRALVARPLAGWHGAAGVCSPRECGCLMQCPAARVGRCVPRELYNPIFEVLDLVALVKEGRDLGAKGGPPCRDGD